jgi:serine/threonine protein kinase
MLASGTRLGTYEILAPLGAGGMGEVYRARHSKLDRDVAIKVLPESVAADPVALARFEREAVRAPLTSSRSRSLEVSGAPAAIRTRDI